MRYNILLVSDYFYPNMGGVENHMFAMSQCLIERGHKVVVFTHNYQERFGVRYMVNGLKVYYVPMTHMKDNCAALHFFSTLHYLRNIIIREQIDIVHCHQGFSLMGNEAMLNSNIIGKPVVFTDHSLIGITEFTSFHVNKGFKQYISGATHIICVSHCSKENIVLRAKIPPSCVSVIPNAIDCTSFVPDLSLRPANGRIVVVAMSRLAFRKGIDLLIKLIPIACKRHSNLDFLIGGDGPKKRGLQQMISDYNLQERVTLLGGVPHSKVAETLNRGHIFINTSLTEAFCIAMVEAASCGLLVVATAVGGVPEVLPNDISFLAPSNALLLCDQIDNAIEALTTQDPLAQHEKIKTMYNWRNIAERTEVIYDKVVKEPKVPFVERFKQLSSGGRFVGKVFAFAYIFALVMYYFYEKIWPAHEIDICPDCCELIRQKKQTTDNDEPVVQREIIKERAFELSPIPSRPSSTAPLSAGSINMSLNSPSRPLSRSLSNLPLFEET
eukprot:TRINITY_DN2305_c0_g1_i1.p1 TRINITY_DN2305_c0_g1~~TRINITY_DN2305_c0_g1_i1.p1  ORF type:complete len:498 (+),score=67.36 TRINITY_DN2305_c0_g1_i1:74-1567(+)